MWVRDGEGLVTVTPGAVTDDVWGGMKIVWLEGLKSLKIIVSVLLAEAGKRHWLLNRDVFPQPAFLSQTWLEANIFLRVQDWMHQDEETVESL